MGGVERAVEKAQGTSEHQRLYIALRTRTRLVGTFNLALALQGRSTGWGEGKPRRTFVGLNRGARPPYHRGIEILAVRGAHHRTTTLLRIPLGSGLTTWRFRRG